MQVKSVKGFPKEKEKGLRPNSIDDMKVNCYNQALKQIGDIEVELPNRKEVKEIIDDAFVLGCYEGDHQTGNSYQKELDRLVDKLVG